MNRRVYIELLLLVVCPLHLWGYGWVTIRTSVMGGHVVIDQMGEAYIPAHERSYGLDDGLHLIMVDKDGYYPFVDTIMITDGSNRFVPVWLEPQSMRAVRSTTAYKRTTWDYQLANGLFAIRWAGIGGGIGSGLDVHASLLNMRIGLFTIEPLLWGMNLPFVAGVSHVTNPWLVHQRDRRSDVMEYPVAIPTQSVQFYYCPMVGVVLPIYDNMAFTLSAGPQISWTHIEWSCQTRELPTTYTYTFTTEPFPDSGFQFDPVWFSVQVGVLFNGYSSDMLTYLKYQDGFFVGMEYRF